jgi:uncharacterized protein (TIGR02284 family)
MTQHSTETTTLNTLIGTLLDSVDGYQKSAQDIDNPELSRRFLDRANERQKAVAGLQAAVARLGGNPEDDSTLLGSAHRVFVDLKAAVTGRDDQAIVNEVERGEDYLKGKFQAALKNVDLAPDARAAIEQAWQSVQAGHDEMSQLKHQMQGYRQGVADSQASASQAGLGSQASGSQAGSGGQQYAAQSSNTASGETFVGGDTAGSDQRPLTGTDTYQQQAGGYPGTIGSERGGFNT